MTQKKRHNSNLLTIAMLLGTCLTFLLSAFAEAAERNGQPQGEVLRLHILPHSDSAEDQQLKYELRDFILEAAGENLAEAKTLDEAVQIAANKLPEIQKNAEAFIREKGYPYNVEVALVNMFFTTRVYENITMPAGNYSALRITIGEGAGQNWWCVVFPPLCLPVVTGSELYFTPEASEIIETGGSRIEVRFKLFEWFKSLFG
jgi:stage II sporulation protein R